jgi:hypothetical protein
MYLLNCRRTAQVRIKKPANKHKYNTKTVKIHKNEALNKKKKQTGSSKKKKTI